MSIEAFQKAVGPKEVHWIEGASYVDLYDKEQYVVPAAAERRFEADFDVMTRLRFEDETTRQGWLARVYASGSGVAEDEERFLDRARTRSWLVDEPVATAG